LDNLRYVYPEKKVNNGIERRDFIKQGSTTACLLGNVALRSGRRIVWNANMERIEGDGAASKYLSREYRKPWKLSV